MNKGLLIDLGIASGLFIVLYFLTFVLPQKQSPVVTAAGAFLAFIAVLPPLLMAGSFWYVRSYLKADAAYEDLRTANRPVLVPFFEVFLRYPCTAVVLFSFLAGITLAAAGIGGWGPAVRTSLMQVTTPLPPIAAILHSVVGNEDAPLPGWVDFGLSVLYAWVVFSLVAAWFERGNQRQSYVASLFTEEDRSPAPYGSRPGHSPEAVQPEPHEQVLLMQGDRIGAACLPYLRVELSGSEWTTGPVADDRCRGAIVASGRVFLSDSLSCWKTYPRESDWLADWLLGHLGRLVDQDGSHPDPIFDNRLGEAAEAVAALVASGQSLPARPTPTSRGAFHDPDRAGKFRAHLRYLFSCSPKRPALLIAACDAAERLGMPEDLKLLDEQTRNLDVQAGFTIPQTDRILQTRDRVLAREPLRSELMAKLLRRIEELRLEKESVPEGKPLLFRRPTDGAVMVLVVAGSFCRGDDHTEETSPKRRVHLGSYLIDIAPVTQDSFKQWTETQGGVLRIERGFFPVQSLPDDVPQDCPYASHVTWFAAQAYAQWTVEGGHLPTEAQWEKAARGNEDDRRYPTGDAWMEEPVSPCGVQLCHLLEWAQDAYDKRAYDKKEPIFDPMKVSSANNDEASRVVRGRDPNTSIASYFLTKRLAMEPVTGAFSAPVGFRVVVDMEQEPRT